MSTALNMYNCTPRQVRGHIIDCFEAGLFPLVKSSPGMGKSSIFRSVADELGLAMIDHRLSTSEPTDLTGLPQFVDGRARFAPFDEMFPIEGTPIPKGKQGWLVFLDEINSAKKDTQAASYKLVLDRMVGQHRLHEYVVMGGAGNLETDRAIVNPMSTAMQSRVVTLVMRLDFDEFMQDVGIPLLDSRITAYLNANKDDLMDFRPDHKEHTFCCPRTWEFMSRLITDKKVTEDKTSLYAGTITSGVAAKFVQFVAVMDTMVSFEEIMRDPAGAMIPNESASKWAVVGNIMGRINEKNFSQLAIYANRLGLDFRVLFFRTVLAKHPKLRHHDAFIKAMSQLNKYLNAA